LATADTWEALGKPGKALKPGVRLQVGDGCELEVVAKNDALVTVRASAPINSILQRFGEMPLPPYIKREGGATAQDQSRYQSVFAKEAGAVAAPTASLHFTEGLLTRLKARGVQFADVVLHVGLGTFLPIRPEHADDVRKHKMHAEWYEVPAETQHAVDTAKRENRRVIAVGTTSVRALETWKSTRAPSGDSELFIYPGFKFQAVDAMITNFHLPRSTLLMLVSAFAGRDVIMRAYEEAVRQGYRFFSYGDAMFLYPQES
jgi:S-adenosylmethionine:tRNA ribosyltransferase-isomerase